MKFIDRLFGRSGTDRFADFAARACRSRQTLSIRIRDAYPLIRALEQAIVATHAMEKTAAFKVATEGLTLSCAKCGEYTDDARSVALLGGEGGALEQMAGVTFGGPIVASLGQGRCPGCHGDTVNATFDLTRAGIRPAHDQSFDQAVLSDAKSCYFTAATKLAFRKDVERLTEEERFVFVFDTACQLLAEKRQISTKDASDYVKQAILRVGK